MCGGSGCLVDAPTPRVLDDGHVRPLRRHTRVLQAPGAEEGRPPLALGQGPDTRVHPYRR